MIFDKMRSLFIETAYFTWKSLCQTIKRSQKISQKESTKKNQIKISIIFISRHGLNYNIESRGNKRKISLLIFRMKLEIDRFSLFVKILFDGNIFFNWLGSFDVFLRKSVWWWFFWVIWRKNSKHTHPSKNPS
jgi:hypothetical protein